MPLLMPQVGSRVPTSTSWLAVKAPALAAASLESSLSMPRDEAAAPLPV